jgi:collagen type I/II/III/V/XI/XXIV/XXVII alpha
MKYAKRTVRSDPGMSQEQALLSLQTDPSFKPGTRIASFRRRGNQWVAELLTPTQHQAGPPPAFADKEEGPPSDDGGDSDAPPASDSGSDEGPSDGPPSDDGGEDEAVEELLGGGPDEGGDKPEHGKKPSGDDAILHVLTEILHALQGDSGPEGMGGPDALGPGPSSPAAPPPPKHGPAGGPPGGGGPPSGRPMKPGEAPPGSTPVGAPAFASTRQAQMPTPAAGGTPVPAGQAAGPVGPGTGDAGAKCASCGYPEPCPIHGAGAGAGAAGAPPALVAHVAKMASVSPTITLWAPAAIGVKIAVTQAKAACAPYGYQVKKAKKVGDKIAIIATVR